MQFGKLAATSALVIASLGVTAGVAYADPAPAPAPVPVIPNLLDGVNQGINQVAPGIHWNAKVDGNAVVVDIDQGSLSTDNGRLQVRDNGGNVVTAVPLSYTLDDLDHPIQATVEGLRATLVPDTNPASARPTDLPLHDVTSDKQKNFDDALGAAATQFGLATAIGTLVGTVIGGSLGCVVGALVGTPGLVPGWIGGCLAGAAVGISLGAAAGLVLVGVPAAIVVGIVFFNRINNPAEQ
ncbi:hypothetical protein [Nocardia seriolae]|uniref:DUF8020 domain-containing protein n=1 Tax=Nocardia seriolae TaxID=37332 RepID=A0A0B8N888_9NOCA|nr:hypothetical protein [Nocardia seriolae]APB00424.1 hypothetical protein NS506_06388 [Nocardia seriolae]MTJ62077.1 hypothetical protein [Nocardia seriolae]MTJ75195.1 hypothetical protein [Nocardia seriolae]MTJ89897.1 hypothetical protein [Nocardia seriolae]MTK33872.1 hypothetical protein [Nocardia seriolae]